MAGEEGSTCVTNTGVVDLNAHLVGSGGGNLDILDGERLTGLPGDGGLFCEYEGRVECGMWCLLCS